MKKLLVDIREEQLVLEEENQGKYILGGVFSQWDKLNNNNRKYLKEPLVREVNKLKKLIEADRCVGELEHPTTPKINLERVSHKVIDLKVEENTGNVTGKIKLIDTPMGKIAKAIIDSGVKLAISSRSVGELEEQKDGTFVVGDSLNMQTYDLVHMPGVDDALLELRESLGSQEDYVVLTQEEYKNLLNNQVDSSTMKQIKERMQRIKEENLLRILKENL